MTYIYNQWVGYTKPLMDLRDDGPRPTPPDNPLPSESFWYSEAVVVAGTQEHFDATFAVAAAEFDAEADVETNQIDTTAMIVPEWFDAVTEVEPAGFDVTN